jgi:hypothetical protein
MSAATEPPLLIRFLVALCPVRDLLLCAKHLFVEATHGIIARMVRPISLRIRHAKILADARAALGSERQEQLRRSHSDAVNRRAREIVARRQEQDRLRRCARLAARKAILLTKDAFAKIGASTTSDVDQQHWRERQKMVEAALMEIVGTSK